MPVKHPDPDALKSLLDDAIEKIDLELLRQDVLPFIRDHQELELWSKDFFGK